MNLKRKFVGQPSPSPNKIHFEEEAAVAKLTRCLYHFLSESEGKSPVIVCIGTDRSTGDSLGPLVGSKLKKKRTSLHVYGTLDDPVHAVNLEEQLAVIKQRHLNPFVVGVDACLGRINNVGVISLGQGPLKPGAGVKKQLPAVGDIHITGIVNVSGLMEYFVLQNTRLNLVMKMADTISDSIYYAYLRHKPHHVADLYKNRKKKTL
jgi:putative sporulation protein YyaC